MASTSTIRTWWNPACRGKGDVLIPAYRALDACLKAHRYAPRKVDTGAYNCRPITGGTAYSLHAYAPGPRFTFHNGTSVITALAVDLNWQSNPYGKRLITDMPPAMVAAIKAIRTNNGKQVWRWGGDYSGNKDAMHFEVVCHPRDLASGINPATVPGGTPAPRPKPTPTPVPTPKPTPTPPDEEDEDMTKMAWLRSQTGSDSGMHCYRIQGSIATWFSTHEEINLAKLMGTPWAGGSEPQSRLDPVWWKSLAVMNGPLKNT